MRTTTRALSVGRAGDNVGWSRSPDRALFRRVRVSVAGVLLGVAVVALAAPQRASAQDCGWDQIHLDLSPTARADHAMGYELPRYFVWVA